MLDPEDPPPRAKRTLVQKMLRFLGRPASQQKVVSYVLTVAASSEGKQFVLFSAEDKTGMMVGQREIIMQPTAHLGPLEITDSNVAEGRFVDLLPHQEPRLTAQ
jgi:hypothetical protein